jgi:glucose dehydrogenase
MDYLGEYGFKNVGPQGLPLAKPPWGRITAIDLNSGEVLHEMKLPANVTGVPMTYMLDGVQYLVMAIGAPGVPAELIAMTVQ